MSKQTGLFSYFRKSKTPEVDSCSSYSDDSESDKQKDNAKWTRVLSVHGMKTNNIFLYDLKLDSNSDNVKNQVRGHMQNMRDEVLFDPDKYNNQSYDFSLDKHKLSEAELHTYGEMAT